MRRSGWATRHVGRGNNKGKTISWGRQREAYKILGRQDPWILGDDKKRKGGKRRNPQHNVQNAGGHAYWSLVVNLGKKHTAAWFIIIL